MFARSRLRMFGLVCAATLAVGCDSALAAFAVDTSRLPRISGSREVFASPGSTSFITRESVTRAFEITATELINDDGSLSTIRRLPGPVMPRRAPCPSRSTAAHSR